MKKLFIAIACLLSFAASSQVNQTVDRLRAINSLRPPLDTSGQVYYFGEIRSRLQDTSIYMGLSTTGKKWFKITGTSSGGGGDVDSSIYATIARVYKITDSLALTIDTANLLVGTRGSGQKIWFVNGDSLVFKEPSNTYGFYWTTRAADSALLGTMDTTLMATRAYARKVADSLGGGGGGSGTVTNVSPGYGITALPDPITTTGFIGVDTAQMATRARVQKGIDSVAALIVGGGGVSSVSAGTGMSFTTITSTGAVNADTAVLATRARVQKGIDSVASLIGSASGLTNIPMMSISHGLGASMKYAALGLDRARITQASAFNDGVATYVALYIPVATTISGFSWWQNTQGDYVADNENSISLYSYDGAGGLTEVATTGNDGNLWKGSSFTFQTKTLSGGGTYNAAAGVYFIAFLYNNSSQTTAPTIGAGPATTNTLVSENGYTNSAKHIGTRTAQTTLPGTETMSNLARSGSYYFMSVY